MCASYLSDLVRREQMSKNGHILCLPLEIRVHVLTLIHAYRIGVYSKIMYYRDVLEWEGTNSYCESSGNTLRKACSWCEGVTT